MNKQNQNIILTTVKPEVGKNIAGLVETSEGDQFRLVTNVRDVQILDKEHHIQNGDKIDSPTWWKVSSSDGEYHVQSGWHNWMMLPICVERILTRDPLVIMEEIKTQNALQIIHMYPDGTMQPFTTVEFRAMLNQGLP